MKLYLILAALFLTANLCGQDLKTLTAIEGEMFDFGTTAQADWKARDQLLEDLYSEKKRWDNLTAQENRILEKYDETYESIWDVEGAGCSWYCGAGEYTVSTSSQLTANGSIVYDAQNLADFSYQTAWVEGKEGFGIGTAIAFSFAPTHPRITTLIFANGYVKSKKAWQDNARVHKLKMFVNDESYAIIELKDSYTKQFVKLEKPLGNSNRHDYEKLKAKGNWTIRFEILSVYEGDKYEDTAISEIYFDGLDVHCLAQGTQITMADRSQKAIEALVVGDEVLTYNQKLELYESAVIKELASQVHQDLVTIEFSNGTTITCTKDHPFLMEDLQWTSMDPHKTANDYELNNVKQLEIGTSIIGLEDNLEIVKISVLKGKQLTYTIVGLSKNKTFVANGMLTGIEKLRLRTLSNNQSN